MDPIPNKIKIVYLLPIGLSHVGGMERVTTIKANYLAEKAGFDVSIITTEQSKDQPNFFPISDKIHIYHLNIGIHANFNKETFYQKIISRFFKIREYKKKLSKLLQNIQPDITISTLGLDIEFLHELKDGSIKLGELHFPSNFRELMTRQLTDKFLPNFINKLRSKSLKKKCKKLNRLIVLTNEERSFWDNDNVIVIPNPLSYYPTEISPCNSKKAIAVGRLAYEKGYDLLIKAWKIVSGKHPGWELNIYGEGIQKNALLRLIAENNLESIVNIYEPVKDIHSKYIDHSIHILSSRYLEALPTVMVEAMSCGLPLVSFDSPCGPKDIIQDNRNGFLIPTGDIEKLSEQICKLINSKELRKSMGKTSREMSYEYDEKIIMERWIELFNEVKK